jgi:hypothetical protein
MDGMEKLRRRISSEVTYTGRHPVSCLSQLLRCMGSPVMQVFLVMPVLAEQAVECASMIENSQVFITIFRAPGIRKFRESSARAARTDPIGHTIRGQRVIVPGKVALLRKRCDLCAILILPHSTVACLSFSYCALVEAIPAGDPFLVTRRRRRKVERLS